MSFGKPKQLNSIRFWVKVPVLSEKMCETLPRSSSVLAWFGVLDSLYMLDLCSEGGFTDATS